LLFFLLLACTAQKCCISFQGTGRVLVGARCFRGSFWPAVPVSTVYVCTHLFPRFFPARSLAGALIGFLPWVFLPPSFFGLGWVSTTSPPPFSHVRYRVTWWGLRLQTDCPFSWRFGPGGVTPSVCVLQSYLTCWACFGCPLERLAFSSSAAGVGPLVRFPEFGPPVGSPDFRHLHRVARRRCCVIRPRRPFYRQTGRSHRRPPVLLVLLPRCWRVPPGFVRSGQSRLMPRSWLWPPFEGSWYRLTFELNLYFPDLAFPPRSPPTGWGVHFFFECFRHLRPPGV